MHGEAREDTLELLSGDARAFLEKAWVSRVHLHHTAPERLAGVLSLDDVDRLLTASGLRTPALRVVRDGSVCPAGEFTRAGAIAGEPLTGLVDSRKALALFDDGATLVLQGLHRYWPPLVRMVRDLELALGHPCQANAYLTPPGAQGFARHSDTHDVFVFQTHGEKLWEVVEGDPGSGTGREVRLEPGLVMYLPTGTPHSARSQEQASLHVTIGINRLTRRDLLRTEVARLLRDEEYDAPLPPGWHLEPDRHAGEVAGILDGLAARLRDRDAGAFVAGSADAFLAQRLPLLQGGLLDRVATVDDDTALVRRPTAACVLRDDGDHLRVLLGDRELRMPGWVRPAMEQVRDRDRLRPGDLDLDPQSRLVLCRRLVREGLLQVDQGTVPGEAP